MLPGMDGLLSGTYSIFSAIQTGGNLSVFFNNTLSSATVPMIAEAQVNDNFSPSVSFHWVKLILILCGDEASLKTDHLCSGGFERLRMARFQYKIRTPMII